MATTKAKTVRLSASILNTFTDCPRCFYLDRKMNVKRPRGIFPSLPNGMDLKLKEAYDAVRSPYGCYPGWISKASVYGAVLFTDQVKLDKMRQWQTGLRYKNPDGAELIGAIDDLIFFPETNLYEPLDYKTKGAEADDEYVKRYYQNQANIYALLLARNGYPVTGYATFHYYWPLSVNGKDNIDAASVKFAATAFRIKATPEAGESLFNAGLAVLERETPPLAGPECEYCNFVSQRAAM
jgi:hypothetical protein